MPNKVMDLTGKSFGQLKVISRGENRGDRLIWICQCSCGNTHEVRGANLKTGTAVSCGCFRVKKASKLTAKHRDSHSKEYRSWRSIKTRCYNTNVKGYPFWGGRGIIMCDEWVNSYEAFLNDMGRAPSNKHSIDRIDNDLNYCKSNCRWATAKEQANNRRNNYIRKTK